MQFPKLLSCASVLLVQLSSLLQNGLDYFLENEIFTKFINEMNMS